MKRRKLSVPGLTYLDANRGRLVQVEDDVYGVIRQIEERWPGRIKVYFDKEALLFAVVERELDGAGNWVKDSLVFNTRNIEEAYKRLEQADQHARNGVPFDVAIDKINAQIERDRDEAFSAQMQEAGERLIHALKKDGFYDHETIYGPKPRSHLANKAVRRYRIGAESGTT